MIGLAWRRAGRVGIAACVFSWLAGAAAAQDYPTRTVTIVVPFGPGSVTDAAARLIAQGLQEALGRPFIVENKAGGGGLIAANGVAHATADGYTLLLTTNTTHSAAPGLFKSVPYDPIKDFTPIARVGSFPSFVAVNPDLPIRTIGDLVDYARKNPGKLAYGHGNSTGQITGEALKHRTGIDMLRVGYRSNPAAMTDLLAGHIGMMVPDFGGGLPQLHAGKIRALAVLTKDRNGQLPDIPTLNETAMPGYDVLAWTGLFAPAGVPRPIVDRLNAALRDALGATEVAQHVSAAGADVLPSTPDAYAADIAAEEAKWSPIVRKAGVKPE
jgi:tripartite-type tricarboxylate transporter receptor subunit TctC